MFIDTHCHILDSSFNKDRETIISNSLNKNVKKLIEIGCEVQDWQSVISFAEQKNNVFCAIGLHPHDAKLISKENLLKLEELCGSKKVVGIGETGLDYYYENSPRNLQKDSFIEHLKISYKLRKPVIIHCRNAYTDLINILKSEHKNCNFFSGVVHCFSGNLQEAKEIISLGFYLGIDGPVTYPNARLLRSIVQEMPLEKILLETDSPYLPPQIYRGKRNEPSHLVFIAEEIAKIKKVGIGVVAKATTDNANRLFSFNS